MNKFSMGLAVAIVGGGTAIATAQSMFFFDIRDNVAPAQSITAPVPPFTAGQGESIGGIANDGGAPPYGGRGAGQVLRLNPTVSNNYHIRVAYPNFDSDSDKSTANLWLYVDVADDPAGANDWLSQISVDVSIEAPVTNRYQIASVDFQWEPPGAIIWSSTSNGTQIGAGGTLGISGATASNTAGGPGSVMPNVGGGPYRLARLSVKAASRGTGCASALGHASDSCYNVNLSVGGQLIIRSFTPAVVDPEDVSFGYCLGTPDAAVNGNTVGAGMTGCRDAIIQIRMQADTNGNGTVTSLDIPGFTARLGQSPATVTQVNRFLYDNNNNGNISSLDIPGFTDAMTAPCP
jgi:hypothetical protein